MILYTGGRAYKMFHTLHRLVITLHNYTNSYCIGLLLLTEDRPIVNKILCRPTSVSIASKLQ